MRVQAINMIIDFNKTNMVNQSSDQICLELKTDLLSATIESLTLLHPPMLHAKMTSFYHGSMTNRGVSTLTGLPSSATISTTVPA